MNYTHKPEIGWFASPRPLQEVAKDLPVLETLSLDEYRASIGLPPIKRKATLHGTCMFCFKDVVFEEGELEAHFQCEYEAID